MILTLVALGVALLCLGFNVGVFVTNIVRDKHEEVDG